MAEAKNIGHKTLSWGTPYTSGLKSEKKTYTNALDTIKKNKL